MIFGPDPIEAAHCAGADLAAAVAAVELPPEPPEWIELMRRGPLVARDGRRWRLDDPASVVDASRRRAGGTDLVVDYEHQTAHARENGREAPAAGWIRELRDRDGAIEARVEWTERALAAIRAREYRYYSPSFLHGRADRAVRVVTGAGLTNTPALDVPALASEEGSMNERWRRLLAALGIDEDADDAAIDAAVARVGAGDGASAAAALMGRVREALGVDADAGDDAVLSAARDRAAAGDAVPRAEFDRVAADLATMRSERREERATAAVDQAVAAGRVPPAQRDWALDLARTNLESFESYAASAPVVAPPAAGNPSPDPDRDLDADERAMCSALGVSEGAFREARARDEERMATA